MGKITTADMNTLREDEWPELSDWPEPEDQLVVLEGEQLTRGFVLPVADESGDAPLVGTLTFDSPRTFAGFQKQYETLHVLAGEIEITLDDDGETVHLAAGHIATIPKGHRITWKVTQTPYRELYVMHG